MKWWVCALVLFLVTMVLEVVPIARLAQRVMYISSWTSADVRETGLDKADLVGYAAVQLLVLSLPLVLLLLMLAFLARRSGQATHLGRLSLGVLAADLLLIWHTLATTSA